MTTIGANASSFNTDHSGGHSGGHNNGHALAFWEPRRALTLEAARRHSTLIVYVRRALMIFSGVLVITLMWYFFNVPKARPQLDNPEETVKMIRPVYKGRTVDNLPFRITADEAVRFIQNPDETKLVNPVFNFLRSNATKESMVLASSGLYDSEAQVLELHQAVNLKTDDGYDCITSHARVFVKDKRIEGDAPIDCTGRFGRATGNAYEINDDFSEFVFKQGITARILPEKEIPASPLRGLQK